VHNMNSARCRPNYIRFSIELTWKSIVKVCKNSEFGSDDATHELRSKRAFLYRSTVLELLI
jgi:hypothetical protein